MQKCIFLQINAFSYCRQGLLGKQENHHVKKFRTQNFQNLKTFGIQIISKMRKLKKSREIETKMIFIDSDRLKNSKHSSAGEATKKKLATNKALPTVI